MDYKKALINKSVGRNAINFQGVFPVNKWAKPEGKVYLSEAEWEWVQNAIPHLLGVSWVEEGQEPKEVHPAKKKKTVDPEFFKLHHNTAKSQIEEMSLEDIDAYIEYADENNIVGGVVNALIKASNEKSE
jgi:hypothetical protein